MLSVGGWLELQGLTGAQCCTLSKALGSVFCWTSRMQVVFILYLHERTVLRIKTDQGICLDSNVCSISCNDGRSLSQDICLLGSQPLSISPISFRTTKKLISFISVEWENNTKPSVFMKWKYFLVLPVISILVITTEKSFPNTLSTQICFLLK